MREFFDLIWGDLSGRGLYGEIRPIKDGAVIPLFTTSCERAVQNATEFDQKGWDAYFGVIPRIRQGSKASDTRTVTGVLWADVDEKNFGSKQQAFWAIASAAIEPSILVDSGHGFHAYWLLEDEVAVGHASNAMRGIAKLIGGDAVADSARILRVPGTHNYKTEPAIPVRLLKLSDRRYRFSDFAPFTELADGLDEPQIGTVDEHWEPRDEPLEYHELPVWLRELIAHGKPKGQRSEYAFKTILWLIRYGWEKDDIFRLFSAFPAGIGAKLVDKGRDAGRWFDVTYNAALAAADVEGDW